MKLRIEYLIGSIVIPMIIFFILFMVFVVISSADEINMGAIKQIESSGDEKAYNKISKARGLYQITPICRDDYALMTGVYYDDGELFDGNKNYEIANWYMNKRIPQLLNHYGHKDTINNRLIAYNCGIGCVGKPLPKETVKYIQKYIELTE